MTSQRHDGSDARGSSGYAGADRAGLAPINLQGWTRLILTCTLLTRDTQIPFTAKCLVSG
jgi:hypothetical protein